MPLKVDSLVANSITSNVIIMEGSPIGGTNLFPGKINDTDVFTQVGTSEMKLDSFVIPANTFQGVMSTFPYFRVITQRNDVAQKAVFAEVGKAQELILKFYVSESDSFEGQTPFYQTTSTEPTIDTQGVMLQAYYDSGFPGFGTFIQYEKNKIKLVYQNLAPKDPILMAEGEQLLPGDGGIPAIGGQSYTIQTFDNYDVSKNLYFIVTAQSSEGQIEAKVLAMSATIFK